MRNAESTPLTLARWRTARRAVLGAILIAGSVVTSAAVMYRMAARDCASYHRVDRAYTYSGIGVVIELERGQVIVRRVFSGSPAQGILHPGARLVSVDGEAPATLEGWAKSIRGEVGSTVAVEVAYPCGGHKVIELKREIVRMRH